MVFVTDAGEEECFVEISTWRDGRQRLAPSP